MDTWLQSPVGTRSCVMDQHQPPAAHGAPPSTSPCGDPADYYESLCHDTSPPKRLLWAHHPLRSSDGFGDPLPRYNIPGSLGGSSGKAPWLGGYSLWAGVQGAMNPVWAQHKDPGGHPWGYHAPHNCLLLARQDADAGSPTSADTAAAARALPALAASLCWSLGRRDVAGQGSAARGIWNHSPHGTSLLNPNREDKKYFSTQQTPSTCKC